MALADVIIEPSSTVSSCIKLALNLLFTSLASDQNTSLPLEHDKLNIALIPLTVLLYMCHTVLGGDGSVLSDWVEYLTPITTINMVTVTQGR